MGDNSLQRIETGTFDLLHFLENLRLANNLFKSFQPGLFQRLTNLIELSLTENPLEANQHEDTFKGLGKLKMLTLCGTPFAESVDRNAVIFTKHLRSDVAIKLVDADFVDEDFDNLGFGNENDD